MPVETPTARLDDVPKQAGPAGAAGPGAPPPPARRFAHRRSYPGRIRSWLGNPGQLAVTTWLVATAIAYPLPALVGHDPFTIGGQALPIAGGLLLVCLVLLVAVTIRHRAGRAEADLVAGRADADLAARVQAQRALAGISAGLAAGWLVLALRTALHGTPYGFGGLRGDMLRMSAAVTRYTTTTASVDTTVPGLPSEYPPLYAWLVGRASVLLDQPAWRLLADAEILVVSACVVAAYLLWRRQVGEWTALAIACIGVVAWSDPRKAYEVLALVIFVPWVVETFTRPPRPRLHWLPAGLLGGVLVLLYQAWLVYAAIGLVAIVVLAWRSAPDRRAYLRRLSLVTVVAVAVSSWYVWPYLWGLLTTGGGQFVSDRYVSPYYLRQMLPMLDVQPGELSNLPLRAMQIVGLAGLVWLLRSTWWARPLLLIAAGAFGYRLLCLARFMVTGHTGFGHYTSRLYGVVLAVAGVLTVAHAVPILLRRLRLAPPVGLVGGPLAVLLAWSVVWYANAWLPGTGGPGSGYTVAAHAEPLPGGGYPRYAPADGRPGWFPVGPVQRAVERTAGPDPDLVTLSVDERLFAYLPWPGYLSNDRTAAATLSRWDDRKAQVRELTELRDPVDFAVASAWTAYGPIDVFVLRRDADELVWADLRFHPDQFDERYWVVHDDLPEQLAVYVRR
ncbi:arabinofuranosyltransferase [Solwaraspora sp. WMMD406]|uniref:arabinofuranosyltransferase n=1 Tax=Solwaraspora sp. WMMD406 TaxID=3016095 RepID=UPI00241680B6|nr:arabinofuranosyltransferase [Solwaraspora sp. WMMD406]MDG4763486.1 arabinofuranosyltransferase [Solwaraspora sp. WMMD406]